MRKILFIFYAGVIISGCSPAKITSVWKAPHMVVPEHHKIMVVGIIKSADDSLRMKMEDELTSNLVTLGYMAVSSLREFGPKGLSDLGEEATYIRLCNNGIDAVLTIALLDKTKEKMKKIEKSKAGTNYYYYRRIWNYRTMQADISDVDLALNRRYLWESILFDLNTLEPVYVMQSRTLGAGEELRTDYGKSFFNKMKEARILNPHESSRRKPF